MYPADSYSTIADIDNDPVPNRTRTRIGFDDFTVDVHAIAVNAARRSLNVGTWLTSRPRVFPLRVVFPTDAS